jgi:hypothetical protein
MSTFLELVQDLHRESGASGSAPTTVLNQRGENNRLVNWIRQADTYIQDMWENWKFLRAEYSENCSVGSNALPIVQDVAMYDHETFFITEVGDTEKSPIEVVEYEDIKREIRDTENGVPYRVVIMPDNTLQVDPPADDTHLITGDYYKNAVELTANDDVSVIPERFHKAILGYALILYANYENATEIKRQGEELFGQQIGRLENNQLPNKYNSRFRTGGGFQVIAE